VSANALGLSRSTVEDGCRGAVPAGSELSLRVAGIRSRWVFQGLFPQDALESFSGSLRGFESDDGRGGEETGADITVLVSGGSEASTAPLLAADDRRLGCVRSYFLEVARRFPSDPAPELLADRQTHGFFQRLTTPELCCELERFADSGDDAILSLIGNNPLFVYPGRGEVRLFLLESGTAAAQRTLRAAPYFTHAVFMPRFDGLLLHATAIRSGTSAHVFMGCSGSGKTTIARLLRRQGSLSDDGTAVRRQGDEFRVFPTPWQQAPQLPASGAPLGERPFRLGRLFILEQDRRVRFERTPPEEAMAAAFRSFVHCVKHMDGPGLRRAFTLAGQLFSEAPCYRMHFTKSAAFWPRIASLG